jgi:hypothetical protein
MKRISSTILWHNGRQGLQRLPEDTIDSENNRKEPICGKPYFQFPSQGNGREWYSSFRERYNEGKLSKPLWKFTGPKSAGRMGRTRPNRVIAALGTGRAVSFLGIFIWSTWCPAYRID